MLLLQTDLPKCMVLYPCIRPSMLHVDHSHFLRGMPGIRVCPCPSAGFNLCDGTCTDLQTDEQHCGACEIACPSGAACSGGSCGCLEPGELASTLTTGRAADLLLLPLPQLLGLVLVVLLNACSLCAALPSGWWHWHLAAGLSPVGVRNSHHPCPLSVALCPLPSTLCHRLLVVPYFPEVHVWRLRWPRDVPGQLTLRQQFKDLRMRRW